MTRHDADHDAHDPHDPHDDDLDLDAFLTGEDDLSAQLRDIHQPAPPPALDARIRAHAREALRASAAAANDAIDAEERALVASPLGRWRAPLALAATVVIGVSLGLQWDGWRAPAPASLSDVPQPVAAVPPAEPAPAPAPAPQAPPAVEPVPVAPAREDVGAAPAATRAQERARSRAAAQAREREREAAAAHQARVLAEQARALAAPPPPAPAPPAPPAPKGAPTMAASAYSPVADGTAPQALVADGLAAPQARYRAARPETGTPVEVAGSSIRRPGAEDAAAERRARRWLQLLDELLDLRLDDEARTSWRHFRAEYPAYPVPPALQKRIDALPAGGD
ncbi:hypothetical protein [uncultured Massilia sp.]|uniref:hypothetical protein n=1 Tax=uncultured Massilia sp. TaxID=169973 RepID=UPI0025D2B472|nr:hypothetical protein [uncultured Massilia sp.]